MAVSNVTSAVIRLGDGVTVAFDFDLEAIDAASIKVGYIEGFTVVNIDPLTYSVAMNAGLTGGTVTFLVAPEVGEKIYIFRQTDKTQVVSVSRQQSYNPAVVERVWDKLTLISQELKRDVDRAVKTGPDADPDQLIADIATARQEAVASATAAAGSAQLANDWAQKAENVPVVAGQFSALHHAAKALASATAAAASAASVDFNGFGYGITGNAPLIANLDTSGLASGIYRFDGTTLGSFPAGVAAADTGIVVIERMDADDERMSLHQGTTQKSFTRRRNAGVLSAWFAVPDYIPVQQNGGVGHGSSKINLGWDGAAARLTVDGLDQGRLVRNADAAAGTNGALFAPGNAPLYACRAWVNFNGTGTVAIRASGNVASITDHGAGDYTINFATALPDANYAITGVCSGVAGNIGAENSIVGIHPTLDFPSTTAFRIRLRAINTNIDGEYVTVAVFR